MPKSPDSKRQTTNLYAKYSGVAFNMAVAIGLGVYLGGKLDTKYGTERPYFAALGAIVGLSAVMYQLFRMLAQDNKKQQKK